MIDTLKRAARWLAGLAATFAVVVLFLWYLADAMARA